MAGGNYRPRQIASESRRTLERDIETDGRSSLIVVRGDRVGLPHTPPRSERLIG